MLPLDLTVGLFKVAVISGLGHARAHSLAYFIPHRVSLFYTGDVIFFQDYLKLSLSLWLAIAVHC